MGIGKSPGISMPKTSGFFGGGREKTKTNTSPGVRWAPGGIRCKDQSWEQMDTGPIPWSIHVSAHYPSRRPFTPAPATKVSSPDANCGRMPLFCTTLRAWLVMHECMCTTGHAWVYVHDWFEKRLSMTRPLPGVGVVVRDGRGVGRRSLPQVSHDRCATASHKMPGRTGQWCLGVRTIRPGHHTWKTNKKN